MPATHTLAAPAAVATAADPCLERAAFFFDLEMAELTAIIPQAAPAQPIFKY